MNKRGKVSITAVIMNCICAVLWNIIVFFDLAQGFADPAFFVLRILCAIVWDFSAARWVLRYLKSRRNNG